MVWRKGRDQGTRRLPKAGSWSNRFSFLCVDACSSLLDFHSLTSKCLLACSPKIRNLPTISYLQCMCILLYAHWDPGYCVQVCAQSEIILQWSEDWVCAKWDSLPVICALSDSPSVICALRAFPSSPALKCFMEITLERWSRCVSPNQASSFQRFRSISHSWWLVYLFMCFLITNICLEFPIPCVELF